MCNKSLSFDPKDVHECDKQDIIDYVKRLETENRNYYRESSKICDAVESFVVDNIQQLDDKSVIVSTESLIKLYVSAFPNQSEEGFKNFSIENMSYMNMMVGLFDLFKKNDKAKRCKLNGERHSIRDTLEKLLETCIWYNKCQGWEKELSDDKFISVDDLIKKIKNENH